ncbi:DUF397 domain-containing protein [Actinoplanes sp. NPDC023714]|uniref:DUF397 domain-containing protein n=1 Tax=Actinoplanes sp. NPDC023714 TaxID=3154322 RepID=UPI0033FA0F4E
MAALNVDRDLLQWRKSRRSSGGNCVEVAPLSDGIAMRNSRFPDGEVLICTNAEFEALLSGIKDGEFDNLVS